MGHIAVVNPPNTNRTPIQRRIVSEKEIKDACQIERHYVAPTMVKRSEPCFVPLYDVNRERDEKDHAHELWSLLLVFKPSFPMWKGFMNQLYNDEVC